jgi:hypothetical protein
MLLVCCYINSQPRALGYNRKPRQWCTITEFHHELIKVFLQQKINRKAGKTNKRK